MKIYLLTAGALCILYYLVLVLYSKRLNSTFSGFWLMAGGAHLIPGCAPLPASAYRILAVPVILAWGVFLIVESKIVIAMMSKCREDAECIIILGAQVRGKRITNSLKRRLDAALLYLENHPRTKVIVSGGQGRGEDVSEAEAMSAYLIEKGVDRGRIYREERSVSTRENFRFSRKYTDPAQEKVGIVTNGFHIYRAAMIAKQEGYKHLCLIPASSNPVFQLNYLMREFFAVLATVLRRTQVKG